MPTLIFLHGLLGSQSDWQNVIEKLPHFRCIALDLPFHGEAKCVKHVVDFETSCHYLAEKIQAAAQHRPYFLVGYSLGGRLALYYALQANVNKSGLQGLILEGANLGLHLETEKQVRWQQDQYWAQRFTQEPASKVLDDWYQQPVFAHLNTTQRRALVQKRADNCGENIANMLLATSLAKQPDFTHTIHTTSLPIFYICGEYDHKFRQLATQYQYSPIIIEQAGHNAHQENPTQFAEKLIEIFAPR
ncbi:2-succinyl-6-hydroxy-2,4-cyclohexadiene-1-carboxylate synthase [Conservatibacter flavescens]|uniref:Putative 2-succinyl-6-hydroxy-2,4-cyclohexadiene-1-carboxylate synthase n=1 Tax=Conservatibacter flavescens TaxID=28161 RepID=A0A2M8S498_9PAST|nr:2-succinyl-6-hydroxy-2,4-cyclohexadiene-1-carboxylate synthase [Conservatibacter flavescens]PJG85965.1 2-succinyl-6-hydroxy-2,4-cyclohexadiene-1-carboxylate synthase [Conservatibacter flavescens]